MSSRVEIGYLCSKGHFIFEDDPDCDGTCGTKRVGRVYVEMDGDNSPLMFGRALKEAREDFGHALRRAYI